jgi:hypothetical protein
LLFLKAGVIFDFLSYPWAALFIAMWNIVSVVIEYFLLYAIYKEFPALGQIIKHHFLDKLPPRNNRYVNIPTS